MSLEQILRFLIIPFNTEKDGIEQIGKFGVGFLSNFYYCINDRNTSITVYTITKDESYSLKFFCPSTSVSDIVLELKHIRGSKKPKTVVKINNLIYKRHKLQAYLEQHLTNIPSYMAKIIFNKTWINPGNRNPWITVPVTLRVKDKVIVQEIGFCKYEKDKKICLTAQGVQVKQYGCNVTGAVISFPSAVKVVEGRDEFKTDTNYKTCVHAAFEAFELHAKRADPKNICDTIELFAELVSAFQVEYLHTIPNINSIEKVLFGDKMYMFLDHQYKELEGFLGPEHSDKIIKVFAGAYQLWHSKFMSLSDFVRDHMSSPGIDMEKWKSNYHRMSHLGIIFRLIDPSKVKHVVFVKMSPGISPLFFKDMTLYINSRHFLCRGKTSAIKLFNFCSEMYQAKVFATNSYSDDEILTRSLFRTAASFYARTISA
jgi:hypothetical protein